MSRYQYDDEDIRVAGWFKFWVGFTLGFVIGAFGMFGCLLAIGVYYNL